MYSYEDRIRAVEYWPVELRSNPAISTVAIQAGWSVGCRNALSDLISLALARIRSVPCPSFDKNAYISLPSVSIFVYYGAVFTEQEIR